MTPRIVDVDKVDYMYLRTMKKLPHRSTDKKTKNNQHDYVNCITSFDIETTNLKEYRQAIMYVWQWAFGDYVVVGRYWAELLYFMRELVKNMEDDLYWVVYVHNLSFEFHFLRSILDWENVFAVDKRKILKAEAMGHFEFRCSYLHSNMSLSEYTSKMKVEHVKLSGEEYDYSVIRYPWTPLTDKEIAYCVHDVIGLVEAIEKEMFLDGDNLYSIPLTSTGYVRRECKKAMQGVNKAIVKNSLPDPVMFSALREAFRGGNTHANRFFAGDVIENVHSYDRSSSYPDVQINCLFPQGRWNYTNKATEDEVIHLIENHKKACLMRVSLLNVRLTDPYWGAPYLSKDKCRKIVNGVYDNGRILSADYLETTLTDIDYGIVKSEYSYDEFLADDLWSCRYAPLPKELKEVIIQLYKDKTELKGVPGQEVYYVKRKNMLNAIYGMSAQNPAKAAILYSALFDGLFKVDESKSEEELVEEANKHAWFCYSWGVWTTAWARLRLEEGIRMVGHRFVYCDTDSVKYFGDNVDWTEYNKKRKAESAKNGACATDPKGVTHYMGVYEEEDTYDKFVTLGAKKYAFEIDGKLGITVAGVNKRKGAKELAKFGGLDAFRVDTVFSEAGGTESVYNDSPKLVIEVEGHKLVVTPNIYIGDSTYKIGMTRDYMELLATCDADGFWLDT